MEEKKNEKKEEIYKVTYEPKNYSVLNEAKKRNENLSKENAILPYVITSVITLLISMTFMYIFISNYKFKTEATTKLEKDVTVTDEGIADAVEKIYDAVVVVENYNDETLYSTGTGFVYKVEDDKAYILTNNHVIDNGNNVKVVFTDDKKVTATVIGGDVYSDIAVLSVSSNDIISVSNIGSSEELRVGDTTFAVGAPLDSSTYSWTVTRGILSGKNRLVEVNSSTNIFQNSSYVMEVLQTDTAINSGNSGGPLCNSNGEVIGITNMKISSSTVEGMGFAIPIETAITYADKYINGEVINRPYLGISMYDVTSKKLGLSGIYIQSVEENSPAFKAGLKSGDIIVSIDSKEVKTSAYLKFELYKHNIGDEIAVEFYRDNKKQSTKIKLGSNSINS